MCTPPTFSTHFSALLHSCDAYCSLPSPSPTLSLPLPLPSVSTLDKTLQQTLSHCIGKLGWALSNNAQR